MNAKYDYLFHGIGDKSVFLKMYADAEEILETQSKLYKMSDTSYTIQANLNLELLKRRRRENYQFLLNNLNTAKIKPLITHLPDNITPLFFPILCNVPTRASLQVRLRNNHIYAPIIWPKCDWISCDSGSSDLFYQDLLCIPIDQRYDTDDMHRIVDVCNTWQG